MSKNKLKNVTNNRDYSIIMKNQNLYCRICVRRSGSYEGSCHPGAFNKKGHKYREYRTWKHTRYTQWK